MYFTNVEFYDIIGGMNEELETEAVDAPTPVKVVLTKDQEALIFKSLVHKTYKEAGHDFGIHMMFPDDDTKVTSFVFNIARRIKKAPELWGISPDVVDVVQEAMDKRSIKKNPGLKSDLALQEESFRDKLDVMRDTVAEMIDKKLKKHNSVRGIDGISIRDLKDLLSMTIDKSRLMRGESTENIKKMSPLDTEKMTPEEALAVVIKARDILIEGKR